MSNPSDPMRAAKLDLSPYLFHFIKGHVSNPMADLMSILRDRKIYSRSRNNYICFTSSPITQVGQFFETQNHNTGKPLYHLSIALMNTNGAVGRNTMEQPIKVFAQHRLFSVAYPLLT